MGIRNCRSQMRALHSLLLLLLLGLAAIVMGDPCLMRHTLTWAMANAAQMADTRLKATGRFVKRWAPRSSPSVNFRLGWAWKGVSVQHMGNTCGCMVTADPIAPTSSLGAKVPSSKHPSPQHTLIPTPRPLTRMRAHACCRLRAPTTTTTHHHHHTRITHPHQLSPKMHIQPLGGDKCTGPR